MKIKMITMAIAISLSSISYADNLSEASVGSVAYTSIGGSSVIAGVALIPVGILLTPFAGPEALMAPSVMGGWISVLAFDQAGKNFDRWENDIEQWANDNKYQVTPLKNIYQTEWEVRNIHGKLALVSDFNSDNRRTVVPFSESPKNLREGDKVTLKREKGVLIFSNKNRQVVSAIRIE